MNPCFVAPTAVPARSSSSTRTAAVSPSRPTRAAAAVSMSAGDGKKKSLSEWLYSKMMHNALWEGDEEAGYEVFFKEAMSAREDAQKELYGDKKEEKTN